MSRVAKPNKGGEFEPASAGLHNAVCAEYIDLGMQTTPYGDKEQGKLIFQVEECNDNGDRKEVTAWFTVTLGSEQKPSKLRTYLEGWRGKKYKDEDIEAGVDLSTLVGKPCQLQTIMDVAKTSGNEFAKLLSVMPPPKDKSLWLKIENYVSRAERDAKRESKANNDPEAGGVSGDDIPF